MPSRDTLHGPGELIAAVPGLLGYVPCESLVIAGLAQRGELRTLLRVDRADAVAPESARPVARGVAAHLARAGAVQALVVSFTDDDVRVSCPAADALRTDLGVGEVEVWAVRRGRYFAPGCARESCCPTGGRPLPPAPLARTREARLRDVAHVPAASALDALPQADEAARRRVERAGARWDAHRDADPAAWRRRSLALWRDACRATRDGALPGDAASGRLVAALHDRAVRDAILVTLIPGWRGLAERIAEGRADADVQTALGALLSPERGERPRPGIVEPAWDLCSWLATRARPARRAPMLTLCALIAWWEGDAAQSAALLARATRSDETYRLALLLECTIGAGIEPGWRRAA